MLLCVKILNLESLLQIDRGWRLWYSSLKGGPRQLWWGNRPPRAELGCYTDRQSLYWGAEEKAGKRRVSWKSGLLDVSTAKMLFHENQIVRGTGSGMESYPSLGLLFESFFFLIFFFLLYFTLQYYIGFNIHWPESTTGVHVIPTWTPLPPPSPQHPSGSSPCTSPKHAVSCIRHRLVIRFLHDSIHVSMPFSQIIPTSPSPSESQIPLYT